MFPDELDHPELHHHQHHDNKTHILKTQILLAFHIHAPSQLNIRRLLKK